jgi:uncharacterized membrane protein YkvA (DUF1232 family)
MVPLVRDVPAAWRLLRDKQGPVWAKILLVTAVAYVIWPLDLIPDAVPLISWIDDMGVVFVLRLVLHRQLVRYREGTPSSGQATIGIDSGRMSA